MVTKTREDHHVEILAFLTGALARTGNRATLKIGLYFRQPGIPDEELFAVHREEPSESKYFDTLAETENLVRKILDRAESAAGSFTTTTKARRFIVRTQQVIGAPETHYFALQPTAIVAFDDDDEDGAPKAAGAAGDLGDAFRTLVKVNAGMFGDALGTLAAQIRAAIAENTELRQRNRDLEKMLDTAQSDRLEREWTIQREMRRENRVDQMGKQFFQLIPALAAKILPPGTVDPKGQPTGIVVLISQFFESLTKEQGEALINMLTMEQKIMLANLNQLVQDAAAEAAKQAGAPSSGGNGAHATAGAR